MTGGVLQLHVAHGIYSQQVNPSAVPTMEEIQYGSA